MLAGWKNSLKGVGYFIGAACLEVDDDWGYEFALAVLIGIILLAYPWAIVGLDKVCCMPPSHVFETHNAIVSDYDILPYTG